MRLHPVWHEHEPNLTDFTDSSDDCHRSDTSGHHIGVFLIGFTRHQTFHLGNFIRHRNTPSYVVRIFGAEDTSGNFEFSAARTVLLGF